MKCGDRGHVTAAGTPCQQTIGATAKGCIWHRSMAEQRRMLALKGGIASRMHTALPASTPEPPFDSVENVIAADPRGSNAGAVTAAELSNVMTTFGLTANYLTIDAAALIFGVSEKRVRNVLAEHRAVFGPRVYRQVYRGRRDYRYYRLLSEADFNELKRFFPQRFRYGRLSRTVRA